MKIENKHGTTFSLSNVKLSEADKHFIRHFNPHTFHNDRTGTIWAFDEQMPSGRWLENIQFSNDMKTAKGYIAKIDMACSECGKEMTMQEYEEVGICWACVD